jgi:hypothetical protein
MLKYGLKLPLFCFWTSDIGPVIFTGDLKQNTPVNNYADLEPVYHGKRLLVHMGLIYVNPEG